ncbi:MAG: autotransporter domain-containing protein, partial [Proteobacteria bacterium]|nr:autotransporter domain-containing protein [Pseudomonadota bacterium]
GSNTYTGGTTVSAGTLTGNATSLQGDIANNASLVFAQTGSGTYAGIVSGTGVLVKSGAGNLTLSGANTYSGGTTVSAGTLTGNATSLQGNIVNSTSVVFDQGSAGTYAGIISGTGSLTKIGAAKLTLGGANTHTGGTILNSGVLEVSNDNQLGGAGNTLTFNGGTLGTSTSLSSGRNATLLGGGGTIDTGAFSSSLTGVISGSGALTKTGVGTLTLTAANTYTGGTTVSAGTLAGNTTSLVGSIVNNDTLEFNQTSTGTHTGAITGSGNLIKTGAAKLTLGGTYGYTGTTTVSAGILEGTSANMPATITNNATLEFNQNFAGTYGGTVSGTGGLTKSGSGALTLSGNNTYTGATTVSGGTLNISGTLASSITTIASGGRLAGTGTTADLIINSGGTAAPGNSIGTMNVSGPLTFNLGSIYEAEVNDAGQSDLTAATGAITINGGTVSVIALAGSYPALTTYTILTGSSVTGTFSGATINNSLLVPILQYTANSVLLNITPQNINLQGVSSNANTQATASGIESLGPGDPLYNTFFPLNSVARAAALEQLTRDETSAIVNDISESAETVRNLLLGRMNFRLDTQISDVGNAGNIAGIEPAAGGDDIEAVRPDRQLWAEVTASRGQTFRDTGTHPSRRSAKGFVFGADWELKKQQYVGVYAGMEDAVSKTAATTTVTERRTYQGGVYAGTKLENGFSLNGGLNLGFHTLDTRREIDFTGFFANAYADTRGYTSDAFIELSRQVKLDKGFVAAPFLGFNIGYTFIEGYTERGAGSANLVVNDYSGWTRKVFAGTRLQRHYDLAAGGKFLLEGTLGFAHELGDIAHATTLQFQSGSAPFSISQLDAERTSAFFGINTTVLSDNDVKLYANYWGRASDGMIDQGIRTGVKISF